MSEFQLHVCPNVQKRMEISRENRGDPIGTLTTSPHMGLHAIRASMLYIHGDPEEWEDEVLKRWLHEYAMTRLVDDNPARVVWCRDA
jgi:hypothetical protein